MTYIFKVTDNHATLDTYEDWASEDKIALAIMYDLGIVDDELLSEHNVSLDSVKSYIGIYVANYINYIGTRDGVEKVSSTTALLPATAKQGTRNKHWRRGIP